MSSQALHSEIARNVRIHDRLARSYEKMHGEIFNAAEQARLGDALARAASFVVDHHRPLQALDFGCGSGNLTAHLLQLGMHVTATDVSQGFLNLVKSRHPSVRTLLLANGDLSAVPDDAYDFVATYSVLHHVPDYLAACSQLARICRKGGVILIDHEPSEEFWQPNPQYAQFQREALRTDWMKYLRPENYLHRLRRMFNPRYSNEGDIHVWPDDHVEWPRIKSLLDSLGFEVVVEEAYLLNRRLYRREVYDRYADRLTDAKLMVFRKKC